MITEATTAFLRDLGQNNSRDWFEANRDRYTAAWTEPAAAFQAAMALALEAAYGTPVRPKLFRIHRDIRFSKDKTPYNAYLRMTFYPQGRGDIGWMVGIEPKTLVLGFGMFQFSPAQLRAWRAAVDGPAGAEIAEVVGTGQAAGLRLNDPPLKRVPAPYAKDHPRGALLRRKGLALWQDRAVEDAFGADAPARLVGEMALFDDVRGWLAAHLPAA